MNCDFLVPTRKNKGNIFIAESIWGLPRAPVYRVVVKLKLTFKNFSKLSQRSYDEMRIDFKTGFRLVFLHYH